MTEDELRQIAAERDALKRELDAALRAALDMGLRKIPADPLGDTLALICDRCRISITIPVRPLYLERAVTRVHLFVIAHRHADDADDEV